MRGGNETAPGLIDVVALFILTQPTHIVGTIAPLL